MPHVHKSEWNELGIRGWLTLVGLAALCVWLIFGGDIWRGVFVLSWVGYFYLWGVIKSKQHDSLMRNNRRSDSICTFARSFDVRSVDTWVIRAVYEGFQTEVSFPIRPDDRISDDLWLDDEDIEVDFVRDIAFRCRRSLDDPGSNPHYPLGHTLRNIVNFLNAQPMRASS